MGVARSAQGGRALGDQVAKGENRLRHLVEKDVERFKVHAFDVPVGLFNLSF